MNLLPEFPASRLAESSWFYVPGNTVANIVLKLSIHLNFYLENGECPGLKCWGLCLAPVLRSILRTLIPPSTHIPHLVLQALWQLIHSRGAKISISRCRSPEKPKPSHGTVAPSQPNLFLPEQRQKICRKDWLEWWSLMLPDHLLAVF